MMDWRYGEQEPLPEEVERLSVLHEELEELVKNGFPRWCTSSGGF